MLIDRYATGWLDELHRGFLSLTEGASLYLLVDGVFVPGLYRDFRSAVGVDAMTLLFESLPACSDAVRDVSPFLLRYETDGANHLDQALNRCDGWPMVSVIETTETLEQLATRLSAWCVVYADRQRFNFRFPDTRRLPGIFAAMTPDQQAQMTGPAKRWSYVGRLGRWTDLPLTTGSALVAEKAPILGDAQFGRMVADSEADEILSRLSLQGRLPDRPLSQMYDTALQALRSAGAADLSVAQRADWCEICLEQDTLMNDASLAEKLRTWRETMMA